MRKPKNNIYTTIIVIVGFFIYLIMLTNNIYSHTVNNKAVEKVFEISGLVSKKALQNFDFGNKNEVFVTQREKQHTYLSRCIISGKKAYVKDYIILENYGHGESIEVITDKNKTYIWIGDTVNKRSNANGKIYYWSKDISRIEYIVDSSCPTGARVGEIKTITNIENISTKPKGKAFRSAVAISDKSNRICFRTQVDDLNKTTYYGIYKLGEINHRLNSTSIDKMDINNFKSSQVTYFTDLQCPNGSFQGFDITESNSHYIYIYGGAEGEIPTIYKYSYTNNGDYNHEKTIKIKDDYVGKLEAEGIKVRSNPSGNENKIYISFKPSKDYNKKLKPLGIYLCE